jgi:UDP-2,3-diacylglucosamine pyrophosphatase LpxH
MWDFDAVIVSDLHLGACNSRGSEILRFLETIRTDRLIIAGDLFESPVLHGLRSQDIAVLTALRRYSQHAHVQWLQGNHDPPASWYRGLLGVEPLDDLVLPVGDASYLVCHGHAGDRTLRWPRPILRSADFIYHGSQRLDRSHRLARWLKRRTKVFIKAVDRVRQQGVAEARRRGLDGVILGHSHVVEECRLEGIHYLNCGCWTEQPSNFVGVRHGRAHCYEWEATLERAARFAQHRRPDDDLVSALA